MSWAFRPSTIRKILPIVERISRPRNVHWSVNHRKVVWAINLISPAWSDGDRCLPVDHGIYDAPVDGLSKNDHFRNMIAGAAARGFRRRTVLFDSWHSSLANLKRVRDLGWPFLTQLKSNRRLDIDRAGYRTVSQLTIGDRGLVVHMERFGPLRASKAVSRDGDVEYWGIKDLGMDELGRQDWPSDAGRRRSTIGP